MLQGLQSHSLDMTVLEKQLQQQQARLKWVQLQQQVQVQNNISHIAPPVEVCATSSGPEFQGLGSVEVKRPPAELAVYVRSDHYENFFPNFSVSVGRRPTEFGGCTSFTKMDLAPPLPLPLPEAAAAAVDYCTSSCQMTPTTFQGPTAMPVPVPVMKEEETADQDHVILESTTVTATATGKESFNKRKADQGQGVAVAEDYSKSKCKDKRLKAEVELGESEVSRNSSSKKPDYIHVRARRGQATDSHSLAERARREKISKKMKCLQDLVPGCSKVTGKAGMLDEIINYVQSLQRQVEFLSMKLAALNPSSADLNVDSYLLAPAKEFPAYVANFPAAAKSPTNTMPHLGLASLEYLNLNPLQKEVAINCMLDHATVVLHPPQPQTATHQGIPNPEQTLTSSCITLNQLQPFSAWNIDPRGLYNL